MKQNKQIQRQEQEQEQGQEQENNNDTLYFQLWENEELQNDKAKNESFKNSQQDKAVLEQQKKQDIKEVVSEIETISKPIPISRVKG